MCMARYLNGWAKYYRQNLLFASHSSAEVNALFSRLCFNRTGKVQGLGFGFGLG